MALTNYALIPCADYQAACDAIRAKTGKSEPIKSGELASEISGITGGGSGGSFEGVHTVTFMSEDGSSVLYERYVADGDDCANVVDRGLLATPTKESTVQYNYTHSGWSLTSGGSADASALKSVTADRTVYAAFNSSTRYYTITYYDGDTVLKTESLPYGSMPSYQPTKDGYGFDCWDPALETVTADASYTAVWTDITFATASWGQISEISQNGEAEKYFAVGDTKSLTLDFSGTTETVLVRIIGFNHDDLADGSGKVGISIALAQLLTNSACAMTAASNNNWCWKNSAMRASLNSGTIYSALPSELRSVIKPVTKTSNGGYSKEFGGYEKNALYTTTESVWLLSSTELGFDSTLSSSYSANGQGTNYAFYNSDASRKATTANGNTKYYLTRSMYVAYVAAMVTVNSYKGSSNYGEPGIYANNPSIGIFGFCI